MTDDISHCRGVEVLRDQVPEQVELRGPLRGERRVRCGAEPGATGLLRYTNEPRTAEPVILQQPEDASSSGLAITGP